MLLLLPAMAEGSGYAVMVGTGVMVGVVAGNDRGGGWRMWLLAKKRRIIIILYNLSYYPKLSQNKSICAHQHSYVYYRRQLHVLQYI